MMQRYRLFYILLVVVSGGYGAGTAAAQTSGEPVYRDVIEKIKQESTERSQIMETISFLTDVHGPRLTGSPITRRAADWTLTRLEDWKLENPHTESWGPFGRGWTLEGCLVNLVQPNYSPLIAHVKAWSPSTTRTVKAVPIYLDAETPEELEQYRGQLGRAIVLISPPRELAAHFEPEATRKTDEELLALANASAPQPRGRNGSRRRAPAARPASSPEETQPAEAKAEEAKAEEAKVAEPPQPIAAPPQPAPPAEPPASAESARRTAANDPRLRAQLQADKWQMAYAEGAAVILEPGRGDGGNVFVASVTMPRTSSDQGAEGNRFSRGPRPWAAEAAGVIPQAVLAAEHYNRLVRMLQLGLKPELEVDILTRFYDDDPQSFNIIAEIPGTDLKHEVVMLGAHFDSWQSGTGATDNAVGCGVAMEAIRILRAIDAQPRRTIRLALWTGEEQGLLGSRAYVAEHFGQLTSEPINDPSSENGEESEESRPVYELKPEQQTISAYYNLDNGTGKIRGVYLQGNEQLRPIFRAWLDPFEELGAATISAGNTGGTDHLSFDGVGIPGFQFIQDAIEYSSRTHHSSMDVYERIQEEDVQQASAIMASFVYHTAMRDELLPRKPLTAKIKQVPQQPPTPDQDAAAAPALSEASE